MLVTSAEANASRRPIHISGILRTVPADQAAQLRFRLRALPVVRWIKVGQEAWGYGSLAPAQGRSPLGHRPYELRHAAVSQWLNSGVPATEVAHRAGHGVEVLMTGIFLVRLAGKTAG